jgi:hypothetical protein
VGDEQGKRPERESQKIDLQQNNVRGYLMGAGHNH